MTFGDYLSFVIVYATRHPEQRLGQVAVNVLRSLSSHAHVADTVMYDLGIDPWDEVDRVDEWFRAVWERW